MTVKVREMDDGKHVLIFKQHMHAHALTHLFWTSCLSEFRASPRANCMSMSCEVLWLISTSVK